MDIPVFQQLTAMLVATKAALRSEPWLVGDADGQMDYDADDVCRTIWPHKLFEVQGDGVGLYPKTAGRQSLPALAMYVERAEYADVRGVGTGTSSVVGMRCDIGVQYMFQTRARDAASMQFASHFSMAIWWSICRSMAAAYKSGVMQGASINIEDIELGSMRLLPPFEQASRAFEADMTIEFKRPPWDTGANSSQVTDLASIYGDLNETGESGASPLLQSIWEQ